MKLMITMVLTIGSPVVFAHNIFGQHSHTGAGFEMGFLVMILSATIALISIKYFTSNKEK
jgi:hypothetical protein|tara:strand:+ start:301 stop:480 length:180 start_codon:yes stop_codon:yes gene_type:complete